MNARPAPRPVELSLRQRRSIAIAEFFSVKHRRELIVAEPTFWPALWLEWSPTVSNYVERPENPKDDAKWLADFWIESAEGEFLLNVHVGKDKAKSATPGEEWRLLSPGILSSEGGVHELTSPWMWARHTLLLNLEQAHPYAVAAHRHGGLKAAAARIAMEVPAEPIPLGQLMDRIGGTVYLKQCAVFALVHRGALKLDWFAPLSLRTLVSRTE